MTTSRVCNGDGGYHEIEVGDRMIQFTCKHCGRSFTKLEVAALANAALVMTSERARYIADDRKVYNKDQEMLWLYADRRVQAEANDPLAATPATSVERCLTMTATEEYAISMDAANIDDDLVLVAGKKSKRFHKPMVDGTVYYPAGECGIYAGKGDIKMVHLVPRQLAKKYMNLTPCRTCWRPE